MMPLFMRQSRILFAAAALAATGAQGGTIPVLFDGDEDTHKISVTVTRGLSSMQDVPDLYLRNARERLNKGESIPDAALRQLARLNDGFAAQRYARRLMRRDSASASDIAYFSAIAVSTGRVATLHNLIAALEKLDPAKEPSYRVKKYIQVINAHAWAGNDLAMDAVIAFNGEGRLFGPLSSATRARILERAEKDGDGRVELRLALSLMETRPLNADQTKWVAEYLDRAGASDHPGIASAAMALRRTLDIPDDPDG